MSAPEKMYSVMGLYFFDRRGETWQTGTIEDGSQIVQMPLSGNGGGHAATAVVWNAQRQRFYMRRCGITGTDESVDGNDVDEAGAPAGDRVDGGGLSGRFERAPGALSFSAVVAPWCSR